MHLKAVIGTVHLEPNLELHREFAGRVFHLDHPYRRDHAERDRHPRELDHDLHDRLRTRPVQRQHPRRKARRHQSHAARPGQPYRPDPHPGRVLARSRKRCRLRRGVRDGCDGLCDHVTIQQLVMERAEPRPPPKQVRRWVCPINGV